MNKEALLTQLMEMHNEIGRCYENRGTLHELYDSLGIGKDPRAIGKTTEKTMSPTDELVRSELDTLRMIVKYVLFDLESTRRENGYLKKMLEEKENDGRGNEV